MLVAAATVVVAVVMLMGRVGVGAVQSSHIYQCNTRRHTHRSVVLKPVCSGCCCFLLLSDVKIFPALFCSLFLFLSSSHRDI